MIRSNFAAPAAVVMLSVALALVFSLGLTGCTDSGATNPSNPLTSVNLQMSALRDTGDTATCVLLDSQPYANVDGTIMELTGCLSDAQKTVNGDVEFGNLGALLNTVIPAKYSAYVSQIELLVQGQSIPTNKIGTTNVKRILGFLNGASNEAANYDKSLRGDAPSATPASVPEPAKAGKKAVKKANNVDDGDVSISILPDFYKELPAPAKK